MPVKHLKHELFFTDDEFAEGGHNFPKVESTTSAAVISGASSKSKPHSSSSRLCDISYIIEPRYTNLTL